MKIYSKEEIADLRFTILEEIKAQFPFETPRHNQIFIIYKIIESFMKGKKFFILESPTGTGKSVIAITATRVIAKLFPYEKEDNTLANYRSLVCTKTKALQEQYTKDYKDIPSLWSASGYKCNRDPENKEAYFGSPECDKVLCFFHEECNYRVAREKFVKSMQGILNYAYFMHFTKHNPGLLVLDEAHNLEKIIVDHLHIKFNPKYTKGALQKLENLSISKSSETEDIINLLNEIIEVKDNDIEWMKIIINKSKVLLSIIGPQIERLEKLQLELENGKKDLEMDERKILFFNGKILDALFVKLCRLVRSKVEWVISERDEGNSIDLKPVSSEEEASFLFSRSKFCILMSATICGIPLFCKTLGIKEHQYDSLSLDSEVPIENRRVVLVNLKGMSYSNKLELLPLYVEIQDKLISSYAPKARALIHSVTYENAEYIKKNSIHKKRMIIPQTEDALQIKKILDKYPLAILVSPSMTEGVDLSEDYCRFISWFKVPFPFLGDAWVKRKKDLDNDWYIRETLNTIVQGCGRGVRSKEDSCLTVVLDGNFNNLRYKSDLMPKWFNSAILEMK